MDAPVIEQRGLVITRREFIEDSKMVAKALLEIGIRKGDIITIVMPNLFQGLIIFNAANRIGAIVTFLNEKTSDQALIRYLKMYNSPLLVTYDKSREFAKFVTRKSPVDCVINIQAAFVDSCRQIHAREGNDYLRGYINYHNLIVPASICKKPILASNILCGSRKALILYTSGSTGEPKSVVFTNRNVLAALKYLKASTHAEPYDRKAF